MKPSKVQQHFLAAFPVIGAHYGIETELLLSKQKPVGWFFTDLNPNDDDPVNQKYIRDLQILNEETNTGKLIFIDIKTPSGRKIRVFAQPENKVQMHEIASCEAGVSHLSTYNYGRNLGYRRRDAAYFQYTQLHFLPESLHRAWSKAKLYVNEPFKHARQSILLGQSNPCETKMDTGPE